VLVSFVDADRQDTDVEATDVEATDVEDRDVEATNRGSVSSQRRWSSHDYS
jgi:hypothetical protein